MTRTRSHGRTARTFATLVAAAALCGCAAVPLEPAIEGRTCCNLRLSQGWISSNNVQGGTLVPAGEPISLKSVKKKYYVYGTLGGNDTGFRDDAAKTEQDTLQWARRIVVADDPRTRIAAWPAEVRTAVTTARVFVGMTREQVLVALGHPSRDDTPDLQASTWRYWTPLEDLPVDLEFGTDGRLAALTGKPSAVRILALER